MNAKTAYKLAYREVRLGLYPKQPYCAYALRSLTAKRYAENWTVKAHNDVWCFVHGLNRYATGLVWALVGYESKPVANGPSEPRYIRSVRGMKPYQYRD